MHTNRPTLPTGTKGTTPVKPQKWIVRFYFWSNKNPDKTKVVKSEVFKALDWAEALNKTKQPSLKDYTFLNWQAFKVD